MKRAMFILCLVAAAAHAEVNIGRVIDGSGSPGNSIGVENAREVENNIFHAPQYMPNYPTAATIWPRVIDVPCVKNGDDLKCEGYHWTPDMGRGEYLFFTPVVKADTPEVIVKPIPEPVIQQMTPIPAKLKAKPKKKLVLMKPKKVCK